MTDNTQPEALRLANVCSNLTRHSMDAHLIAGELRRQHARIAELESELEAVGAGGVQALSAAPAVPTSVKGAMWFTKKPVTIQAIQWTGENLREVITFTDGPPDTRSHHAGMAWDAYRDLVARDGLKIYTLEGKMLASPGDWIIRGVKGEMYPCKDEIFRLTYEPVGEVVSASCDHATVRWLHQTSSVGGGDPRNSRAWPKVSGVSRDEGHSRALLAFFAAEPTDDEMRAVHDTLAASPTPPAEQQATKETSGGFHVWRDISTAPKDGSRFVATGLNYGLYGEVRHTCVAQWFRGCWMEASDWNETSELKYLTHWMPLPSPPDDVAAPAEQQAAQVIINFPQVGTAGPFPVVDGRVSLPNSTMQDLVRMLRPTYEAEQQAEPGAAYAALPDEGEPWRGHKFKEVQRGCWRCDCGKTIKEVTSDQSTPASGGAYAALPEYGINTASHAHFRVLGFTADQMRAFADATHAIRASHGQAPAQTADSQLLQFYGVTTDAELITAQAAHIEKLQAKLTKTPSFAPQRVREG